MTNLRHFSGIWAKLNRGAGDELGRHVLVKAKVCPNLVPNLCYDFKVGTLIHLDVLRNSRVIEVFHFHFISHLTRSEFSFLCYYLAVTFRSPRLSGKSFKICLLFCQLLSAEKERSQFYKNHVFLSTCSMVSKKHLEIETRRQFSMHLLLSYRNISRHD